MNNKLEVCFGIAAVFAGVLIGYFMSSFGIQMTSVMFIFSSATLLVCIGVIVEIREIDVFFDMLKDDPSSEYTKSRISSDLSLLVVGFLLFSLISISVISYAIFEMQ